MVIKFSEHLDKSEVMNPVEEFTAGNKAMSICTKWDEGESRYLIFLNFEPEKYKYLGYCYENDLIRFDFDFNVNSMVLTLVNEQFCLTKSVRIYGDFEGIVDITI